MRQAEALVARDGLTEPEFGTNGFPQLGDERDGESDSNSPIDRRASFPRRNLWNSSGPRQVTPTDSSTITPSRVEARDPPWNVFDLGFRAWLADELFVVMRDMSRLGLPVGG
jgi:hypothetical protein